MAIHKNKKLNTKDFKPGDYVFIRWNPHNFNSKNIVGRVVRLRPGDSVGGYDLFDVHYENPLDQAKHTHLFARGFLERATPKELMLLAERHERYAAKLRTLANTLERKPPV